MAVIVSGGAGEVDTTALLQKANNLSDVADVPTARDNLQLGTASIADSTDFDVSGAASSAQSYAIQRANHTGTQLLATISDAGTMAAEAAADYMLKDAQILPKSATYELAAGDAGKIIECDGTFTVTAPDGLDTGFQVALVNVGSGIITVAAATTLQAKGAAYTLANQYGMATLYHRGSNVWLLAGDLT